MVKWLNIPVVLIIWEDACYHEADRMPLEYAKKYKIYNNFTVGFLIHEEDKSITLATEIDQPLDNNQEVCEGIHVIPKSCILTKVFLQE